MLAKIQQPAKSATQSGRARGRVWELVFAPSSARRPEALMGWLSGTDMTSQVRLEFPELEQAIAFAQKHGIPHQVVEPQRSKKPVKSYGDNFAFQRREPWSH